MDFASQMVLFAKVVDGGSFSAAARALHLSPSAVSRQIAHLEDQFGVRLLDRTSHGISPTETGSVVVADQSDEAKAYLESLSAEPAGQLKVVSTVAFGNVCLMPALPKFIATYDKISVSVRLNDDPVEFATNADVAIQFSEQLEDSSAIVKKIASNRRVLVASPDYVAGRGMPRSKNELASHTCLRLIAESHWNDWIPDQLLNHNAVFEANTADAVYRAVLAGLGIARLSTYLVNDDIEAGRLVRILPDYQQENSAIVAAYSDRRNLSPKIRVFIDYLAEIFGPIPPWER